MVFVGFRHQAMQNRMNILRDPAQEEGSGEQDQEHTKTQEDQK